MIASGGIAANPWARAAFRYGTIALTVLLFLLSIRRFDEHVERIDERLEHREKTNEIKRRMLEAAACRPRDLNDLIERLRESGFWNGGLGSMSVGRGV